MTTSPTSPTSSTSQDTIFKGCGRCQGDLYYDTNITTDLGNLKVWSCWQCGHNFYWSEFPILDAIHLELEPGLNPKSDLKAKLPVYRTHRINTIIDSQKRKWSKWWQRNKTTLHDLLILGNSVNTVAREHKRTTRTVREVRDTWTDVKQSMTPSEVRKAMGELKVAWTDT